MSPTSSSELASSEEEQDAITRIKQRKREPRKQVNIQVDKQVSILRQNPQTASQSHTRRRKSNIFWHRAPTNSMRNETPPQFSISDKLLGAEATQPSKRGRSREGTETRNRAKPHHSASLSMPNIVVLKNKIFSPKFVETKQKH